MMRKTASDVPNIPKKKLLQARDSKKKTLFNQINKINKSFYPKHDKARGRFFFPLH